MPTLPLKLSRWYRVVNVRVNVAPIAIVVSGHFGFGLGVQGNRLMRRCSRS
jgi:hypothetical protein